MLKMKNMTSKIFARKAGLPPGDTDKGETLFPDKSTSLRIIRYTAGEFNIEKKAALETLSEDDFPGVIWIRVKGLGDLKILKEIGRMAGLHKLHLEDLLTLHQRPKLELLPRGFFFTGLHYEIDQKSELCLGRTLSLFSNGHWLISFEREDDMLFDTIQERIEKGAGTIREKGLNYLFYALLDLLIDSYFLILSVLSEHLEALEESVMSSPGPDTLNKIYHFRKIILDLKKSLWSFREAWAKLQIFFSREDDLEMTLYRSDLYDHVVQSMDLVEGMREMISGLVELHMSVIGNRMNEIMKTLTIAGAIFIPLTFLAGLYGMNFEHMPELGWRFGYPAVLLLMSVLTGGLLLYFKKKKWF